VDNPAAPDRDRRLNREPTPDPGGYRLYYRTTTASTGLVNPTLPDADVPDRCH